MPVEKRGEFVSQWRDSLATGEESRIAASLNHPLSYDTPSDMPLRSLIARHVLSASLLLAGTGLAAATPQITPEFRAASIAHAEQVLAERGLVHGHPDELEAIKTELLMVLTEFHDIEQVMGVRDREGTLLQAPGDPGPSLSTVPGLMELVNDLSDAELTLLQGVVPDLTELHRVSRSLRTTLEASAQRARATGGSLANHTVPGLSGTAQAGSRGTLPTASYGCANGRPTYADTVGGFATVQIARGVAQAASRGCDLTALGFNAALVCLITDGVVLVAEGVWAGLDLCTADADSAEIYANYQRNAFLAGQQDQMISTLNTIRSTVSAVPPVSILTSLIATQTAVTDSRDDVLEAVSEAQLNLQGWVQVGASATMNRVTEAETAILAALQTTGGSGVESRLAAIEDLLEHEVAQKRIVMSAVNLSGSEIKYLIVASEPGLGNVDVTFDLIEGYRPGHGFEHVLGGTVHSIDVGVYEFDILLKGPSPYIAYRMHCRRQLGPAGPEGDHIGSVYFHADALNSGGQ